MILTLDDFEEKARRRLPRCLYGFASNGAERGASKVANAKSFEKWAFVPRTLIDVSNVSQETSLFGINYNSPFGIAPMGACALFTYKADLDLAEAAHRQGVAHVLSAASTVPVEEVLERSPRSWYQGYIPADEQIITRLVQRLQAAKVPVMVITVDVPVSSNRDADRRAGFSIPVIPRPSLMLDGLMHPRWLVGTFFKTVLRDGIPRTPNFTDDKVGKPIITTPSRLSRTGRAKFSWEHVKLIRRLWSGPLVLKGVLSVDDCLLARQVGADGVILSNHGGRQLDGAVAPLEVLPRVVDAVGDLPVCLDGGIRRGTDALKAIALGARMVFLGRPMLFAASVGGRAGVEHAIQIMRDEIACSLALLGCTDVNRLNTSYLMPQQL